MVDLTRGPTFRNLILFSAPIMLQGSFQIAYNLVDRMWVGRLGKEAIASVTVGFPVMFFMISMVIGIAVGAGIMIAQYRGAKDRDMVNLTARNFLIFGGLIVILISAVILMNVERVLVMLHTPEEVLANGTLYLQWIFSGLIFFFMYNGVTGIFRGLGDSVTPLKVAAFSTALNIVLDPIFIFGWGPINGYGVEGAGIATVLANAIGGCIIFYLLARRKEWVDLSFARFSFNWDVIRDILRLGLPTTATMMVVSGSVMVVMRYVNELGTVVLAAYGIGIVLDSLLMMPAMSFGQAMTTIAGQNIGAGKPERVGLFLRDTLKLSVGLAVIIGSVLVVSTPWITRVFQPDPVDYDLVYPYVRIYIQIMLIRYVMMSMFFPINGTIRGAGDAMASMFLVIITQMVIRVPAVILLVPHMGFTGIALGLSASTIFGFMLVSIYYKTGIWKKRGLVKQQKMGLAQEARDEANLNEPEI